MSAVAISPESSKVANARRRATTRYRRILFVVEIITPLVIIGALIVWTAAAKLFYFPPLLNILLNFPELWFVDRLTSDVLPSLGRFAIGFGIAVLLGIPIGLFLGRFERVRALAAPLIEFFRAIPPVALIPIVILLFGIGDGGKVLLITSVCIWPILLNALDGASGVESMFLETSTVYRVGKVRTFVRVIFPAALPQIFAGVRIAVALGLILIVVSEMAASTNGIGFVIVVAQRSFELATMWSGVILLGIIGYLLNLAFELLERRAISWHTGARSRPE